MSCLVEDFRFCLLIGVGGFWVFKKGKVGESREEGRISPQNCRVALNSNWVLMVCIPGEHSSGH